MTKTPLDHFRSGEARTAARVQANGAWVVKGVRAEDSR